MAAVKLAWGWLFNFLASASLLLMLAGVVLWVRSYFVIDEIGLWTSTMTPDPHEYNGMDQCREHFVYVGTAHGLFVVGDDLHQFPFPPDGGPGYANCPATRHTLSLQRRTADLTDQSSLSGSGIQNALASDSYFGCHFDRFPYAGDMFGGFASAALAVPIWFLTVVFGTPPVLWAMSARRARLRSVRGLCPVCGYDLRATPERCPECGTPVEGAVVSPQTLKVPSS
jgi:hypothetical protein